jgi:hypothetical protein
MIIKHHESIIARDMYDVTYASLVYEERKEGMNPVHMN